MNLVLDFMVSEIIKLLLPYLIPTKTQITTPLLVLPTKLNFGNHLWRNQ